MVTLEPVLDAPVAVAEFADERLLLLADYHAGFESAARFEEGIELPSRAGQRRERLLELVDTTRADKVVVIGDLTHTIGTPGGAERGEVEVLVESLDVPLRVAKGNHDGVLEELLATDPSLFGDVSVLPPTGAVIDSLAVVHGHTWPDPSVLEASIVCIGHEHPCVRLADDVGGRRIERVWLRGDIDEEPFERYYGTDIFTKAEIVVFPAYNELMGGTWVNLPEQEFLAPFLPEALPNGDAYLLDGTNLGPYHRI